MQALQCKGTYRSSPIAFIGSGEDNDTKKLPAVSRIESTVPDRRVKLDLEIRKSDTSDTPNAVLGVNWLELKRVATKRGVIPRTDRIWNNPLIQIFLLRGYPMETAQSPHLICQSPGFKLL